MCLAFPGKIISIENNLQATVDFDGVQKHVSISLVPDSAVGDHVIVHAGFVIEKLTREDAWIVLEEYEK
ncbi:MAG: hypothetical protein ACD_5C00335G0001, partial [uncultured bacterium]